jgi:hypothetical protein
MPNSVKDKDKRRAHMRNAMTFGYEPDSLREVENVLLDEHVAKVGMSENSLVEEGGGGIALQNSHRSTDFPTFPH